MLYPSHTYELKWDPIHKPQGLLWCGPPSGAMTASTLLWKESRLCLWEFLIIFPEAHFWGQTVTVETTAWQPSCPRSIRLSGSVKFFHTKLDHPCLYGCFVCSHVGKGLTQPYKNSTFASWLKLAPLTNKGPWGRFQLVFKKLKYSSF